ncbi:MAG: SRPBCC domain-containing protein [Chloroflexota bacterium]
MTETISLTQSIPASPDLAFRAFTNQFLLRQWLCNDCKVDRRVNGQYFLSWLNGSYAVGRFTTFEPGSHLAFTRQGSGKAGETQVDIHFTAEGEGTRIDLTHSGLSANARAKFEQSWRDSFENLRYVLETGCDWRIMSRPMLGVFPMSNNELGNAKRRGLDTTRGVMLSGVAPGSGAEAAGLKKEDSILSLAAKDLHDLTEFAQILAPYKGGDVVEVVILRDGETHTFQMQLTKRTPPDFSPKVEELGEIARKIHEEVSVKLDQLIAAVPEDVLQRAPAENEWSVYDNVSHLLFTERYTHIFLWTLASGDDNVPWNDNNILQRAPLDALYPTTAEMVAELRRTYAGIEAMVTMIPPYVVENKPLYTLMTGYFAGPDQHALAHLNKSARRLPLSRPLPPSRAYC